MHCYTHTSMCKTSSIIFLVVIKCFLKLNLYIVNNIIPITNFSKDMLKIFKRFQRKNSRKISKFALIFENIKLSYTCGLRLNFLINY